MNVLIKTATALGFILVIPLFALPAHGAPAYEAGHKPLHHRIADSAKARALVSPGSYVPAPGNPATDVPEPESGRLREIRLHRQQRRLIQRVPRPHETDDLSRNDDECTSTTNGASRLLMKCLVTRVSM